MQSTYRYEIYPQDDQGALEAEELRNRIGGILEEVREHERQRPNLLDGHTCTELARRAIALEELEVAGETIKQKEERLAQVVSMRQTLRIYGSSMI